MQSIADTACHALAKATGAALELREQPEEALDTRAPYSAPIRARRAPRDDRAPSRAKRAEALGAARKLYWVRSKRRSACGL